MLAGQAPPSTRDIAAALQARQALQQGEHALLIVGRMDAGVLKDEPLPTISTFMIAEESGGSGNATLCQVPGVPCH